MRYKEGTLHEMSAKNVFAAPLIIALSGAIASAAPDWSPLYGMIAGIVLVLSTIWLIIGRIFKLHLIVRWHAITMIFTFNLLAFSCLIPFWRVFGEPLWLFNLLVGLFIICYYLSYKFRHTVAKGIFSIRGQKGRFGKIYWIISFGYLLLAGMFTGGGGYRATKALRNIIGSDETVMLFSIALMPGAFIILIPFQGLWTRVEDPTYDFDADLDEGDK